MTRRTLAALCALLAFMAVLAVVPLAAAEPAEAHTKTVERCAYDPFAGQQCWNETVGHTHDPPPDIEPYVYILPPPTTATTQPPPKTCPAGQHSNGGAGKNCHANHSSSDIDCGTGTWSPGHGHTPVPLRPCAEPKPPPECPDGYSGTPPNCVKDTTEEQGDDKKTDEDDDDEDVILAAGMKKAWSWLSGAVAYVLENNAEVTQAEAEAWKAQSEVTKDAAEKAAKGVVDGLKAFPKDLSESGRQRINANIQQVTPVLRAWQNLNPAAQAAIGGVVCYGAGGAISAGSGGALTPGGAAFAGGCGGLAYASTQGPLPQLIPEGWTPPSDDSSGADSGGGSGNVGTGDGHPGGTEQDSGDDDDGQDSDNGDSGTDDGSDTDDEQDCDSDEPSLEGSWDEVLQRHAPKNGADQHALYRQYMCSRTSLDFFCASQ